MDISSIIGIVIGFGAILLGFILEGGSLSALIHQASPFIIIFGGTAGAIILNFPKSDLAQLPAMMKAVFTERDYNEASIVEQLVGLSDKARRDGLLSLEHEAQTLNNPFIKKGLSLVVDGIETQAIKDILSRESYLRETVFESGAKIFEAAGGFSPTMGVCGTVLGMISILADMSNPQELGPKISTAFIATLLGVSFANLLFIPMAGKIKAKAAKEKLVMDMIIEGILSLQAGENPRLIREKLSFGFDKQSSKKGASNSSENGVEG